MPRTPVDPQDEDSALAWLRSRRRPEPRRSGVPGVVVLVVAAVAFGAIYSAGRLLGRDPVTETQDIIANFVGDTAELPPPPGPPPTEPIPPPEPGDDPAVSESARSPTLATPFVAAFPTSLPGGS